MNGDKHDLQDLKNALAELDQQLDQIQVPDTKTACPFCFRTLHTSNKGEVLNFCLSCDTELHVYHVIDTVTQEVVRVGADFY